MIFTQAAINAEADKAGAAGNSDLMAKLKSAATNKKIQGAFMDVKNNGVSAAMKYKDDAEVTGILKDVAGILAEAGVSIAATQKVALGTEYAMVLHAFHPDGEGHAEAISDEVRRALGASSEVRVKPLDHARARRRSFSTLRERARFVSVDARRRRSRARAFLFGHACATGEPPGLPGPRPRRAAARHRVPAAAGPGL